MGLGAMKSFKNISKKIVISLIIFIIFPILSNKIDFYFQNLATLPSGDLTSSAFSCYIFSQTSDQVDPFYLDLLRDGKYFYDNDNYAGAIENFKIAFIGFLDHPPKLLECYIYLTVCYHRLRDLEQSKFYYNEIKRLNLQEHLKSIDPPQALMDKYNEIASYFSRLEAKAASRASSAALNAEVKRLKETIKKNKRDFEAYLRLHKIYLQQNRIKNAKSILKDLLKVDPRNGNGYFELGKILAIEKKFKEALQNFNRASAFLKNDIDLFYERAKAYYELKNYASAKQEFLNVQAINKNYKDTEKYFALIEEKEKRK